MREIRLSGLEGGGAGNRSPYPYPRSNGLFRAWKKVRSIGARQQTAQKRTARGRVGCD